MAEFKHRRLEVWQDARNLVKHIFAMSALFSKTYMQVRSRNFLKRVSSPHRKGLREYCVARVAGPVIVYETFIFIF